MRTITADRLTCPCCHQGTPDQRLIASLNHLQQDLGTELVIHSACRCPKHNAGVSGAPFSLHLTGQAADISAFNKSPLHLYLAAEQQQPLRDGGIGLYPDHYIHVDIRRGRARWYRVAGHDFPITHYLHQPPQA